MSGFTAPVAQDCLHQLTRLINFLLSGKASCLVAPWLCGVPITALHKKNGGVHSIMACETIKRLVSHVCYLSVKDDLPDLFLPYGQVGVGIKGGLEAAIHSFQHFIRITLTCALLSLTCIMLSMKFNEPASFGSLNVTFLEYTLGKMVLSRSC